MKINKRTFGSLLCCCVLVLIQTALGQVRLPLLISDGMVLQRDTPLRIWGWADAGEKITLVFCGQTRSTTAQSNGKWAVTLPAYPAGGPHEMQIQGDNRITLKNILIGDVWVCSGQSNMVLPMDRVKDRYAEEIAAAENPAIRHFLVPMRYDFNTSQEDVESGCWESADPRTVLRFTAAGYFFARTLYEKYHIPIGLINASVGGSPAEAWISEDTLRQFPGHLETANRFKDGNYLREVIEKDKTAQDGWYTQIRKLDKGRADGQTPWYDPAFDASEWHSMDLPGYWADGPLGPVNGVVWFRKEIDIPASMTGQSARLDLGCIVDSDDVYINGKWVGSTSYKYPPRQYRIPEDLLRPGKNTIVIRVVNRSGRGGFVPDKPYQLTAGGQTIDLKGPWQYRLAATADPAPDQVFIQYKPLGLFNGMIAPLVPYRIKGVIWYQGESNTANPLEYQKLFPALITDWRQKWDQGDFPFLYVQLANFMEAKAQPSESDWARLREAQLKTLAIPNTAMAVTIDIGEWNDIHPLNKADVGRRLALAAQKAAYGDAQVVYSGPLYQSMKIEGNRIILSFSNIGSGLMAKDGGSLKGFAIAGEDKKFVWADAKIEGDHVVISSDKVSHPTAVRYAWADNPQGANLYNREGLPASPFRTDQE